MLWVDFLGFSIAEVFYPINIAGNEMYEIVMDEKFFDDSVVGKQVILGNPDDLQKVLICTTEFV